MIEIENGSVTLGDRPVLCELTLHLFRGDKVALSGESGSGKTTLLRVLIGRQRLDQGRVLINGLVPAPESLPAIRSKMFYLPQDIRPVGEETMIEFLSHPFQFAVNHSLKFEKPAALDLLERLHVRRKLIDAKLSDLSGGERKRAGLAQGLLLKRPIMLLDEPTAGVDESNRKTVAETVMALPDVTVLAVTHDDDFMARAGRCMVLKAGQIVQPER